ncbi:unnamed protein product [Brugia timori]|uniref:Uncharacterized protein n=1 Tax=Brugia timori TaxID=42155 RepID=A0A0R3QX05_9BILA|nr:unnamed protein product [Brugia timori]
MTTPLFNLSYYFALLVLIKRLVIHTSIKDSFSPINCSPL